MTPGSVPPPTIEEATEFLDVAEEQLQSLSVEASRARWVHSTDITDDTEVLAAQANHRVIAATVECAKKRTRSRWSATERASSPHSGSTRCRRASGSGRSSKDIALLLSRALDKIAFLPFGLLVD